MSLKNLLPGKTAVAWSLAAALTGGTAAVAATVVFSSPDSAQTASATSSARETAALDSAAVTAARSVSASNAEQLARISAQDNSATTSTAADSQALTAPASTTSDVTAPPAGTQAGVLSDLPGFLGALPTGTVTAVQSALGSGVPNLLGNLGSFDYGTYLGNLPSATITAVQSAIPSPDALSNLLGDLSGPNAAQP